MTHKAILRTAKLKTFGNIGGSLAHNYRNIDTPNADPNRTPNNIHSLPNAESVKNAIQNRLPQKRRSDAVLCIEYLITASPDWDGFQDKEKMNEFFNRSIQFLQDKHGKENVIATSIHLDETTPHLVAYVVPLDDKGKLNCKQFLGGRKKLSDLQTDFANKVKDLGLERGKENSKATHKTIKEFYAEINNTQETLHIEKPNIKKGLFESADDFSQKVIDNVMGQAEILHRENRQLQLQNNLYQERIAHLENSLDNLNQRTKPYLQASENLRGELLTQFNNELPTVRKNILAEHNRRALEQERMQREQAQRLAEQQAEQQRQAENQRIMREKQERFFAQQEQRKLQRQSETLKNASRSVIEPQKTVSPSQVLDNPQNTLKTQNNANLITQWDRNQLRGRGLSFKQAEFVINQQNKILVATINNETARQERLREFQEQYNQIIENNQLDEVMKSYGKGR